MRRHETPGSTTAFTYTFGSFVRGALACQLCQSSDPVSSRLSERCVISWMRRWPEESVREQIHKRQPAALTPPDEFAT